MGAEKGFTDVDRYTINAFAVLVLCGGVRKWINISTL